MAGESSRRSLNETSVRLQGNDVARVEQHSSRSIDHPHVEHYLSHVKFHHLK